MRVNFYPVKIHEKDETWGYGSGAYNDVEYYRL